MSGPKQFPSKDEIERAFKAGAEIIEVERADGSKVIIKKKNGAAKTERNEWDEELYGKDTTPVR